MKPKFLCLLLPAVIFLIVSCEKETSNSNIPATGDEYVVFVWNNPDMHYLNSTYNELVILPPFNTVQAQVIKRGDPPQVITTGLTVEFNILNDTYYFDKREYAGFWTYFTDLFGTPASAHDIGLTGTGLSGAMISKSDHFTAEGIPVVAVNDAGVWNPYQVIEVKVRDASNNLLVMTEATIPTSDEINCAKCHTNGATSVYTFTAI
jgi:hypothetical protein